MEGFIDEKEDPIFEIEPKLLLVGTTIYLEEIVLLLNGGMSKIKSIEESDP
jgi:hypothetical protein